MDWKTPRVRRRTPKLSPRRWRTPRVNDEKPHLRYSPKQFVSPHLQRWRTPRVRRKTPRYSPKQFVSPHLQRWRTPRVRRKTPRYSPKQFVSPHLQRRRTPRVRRKTPRYSPKQFVSPHLQRRLQRLRTPYKLRTPKASSLLDRLSSKSTPIMFPSPINIPTKTRYSPRAQKNWRSGGLSTVPVPIMGY